MKTFLITVAVLTVGAMAAPFAVAQTAQTGQRLSQDEIENRLSAQGYRVVEFEHDDGLYEVKAFTRDDQCVELDVHPRTAEIIHSERDDDCWDRRQSAPAR
jgi:hypothetical protein